MTDGEGRFEFRELPAGRFTMSAIKSGYVSVQFGQTRPFESGKPIELAEGQSVANRDDVATVLYEVERSLNTANRRLERLVNQLR